MSFSSFLSGLPSYNKTNFTLVHKKNSEDGSISTIHKPFIYTATHDRTNPPFDQIITTQRTNILLRYFYNQMKDSNHEKRPLETTFEEHEEDNQKTSRSHVEASFHGEPPKKVPKLY
eukprot:Sdes_comp20385_c0_seq1m14295